VLVLNQWEDFTKNNSYSYKKIMKWKAVDDEKKLKFFDSRQDRVVTWNFEEAHLWVLPMI